MVNMNVGTYWRESVIILAVIERVYSPDEVPQKAYNKEPDKGSYFARMVKPPSQTTMADSRLASSTSS